MLLLVIGIFYVSNTWTPSSYGGPIKYFGVSDRGIVAGTPRGHRSDEWGVATPLTQATVNNDFQRFNQTSIYKEDLRSVFSMPIYDWGMIFKPNMWGYLAFPPAYAFSLPLLIYLPIFCRFRPFFSVPRKSSRRINPALQRTFFHRLYAVLVDHVWPTFLFFSLVIFTAGLE